MHTIRRYMHIYMYTQNMHVVHSERWRQRWHRRGSFPLQHEQKSQACCQASCLLLEVAVPPGIAGLQPASSSLVGPKFILSSCTHQ